MDKRTHSSGDDMDTLTNDGRALMAATADEPGEKMSKDRKRLAAALESGDDMSARLHDHRAPSAKAEVEPTRGNRHQAMGIAFGAGALIGYLAARICARHDKRENFNAFRSEAK